MVLPTDSMHACFAIVSAQTSLWTEPLNLAWTSPCALMGAELWMLRDLTAEFSKNYGVELNKEIDYSIALVQSNPHHRVRAKGSVDSSPTAAYIASGASNFDMQQDSGL